MHALVRWLLAAALLPGLSLGLIPYASAQSLRPMTIIVPYPPGGLSDSLARLVAGVMARNLGTPVVVENRPGANGSLGLQQVAAAKPDGSVIGLVPASVMTTNPFLYADMRVDTLKDVEALTLALTLPNVLVVNPAMVPARTFPELIDYLRDHKGLNYGSMGQGSSAHLNSEMLQQDAKLVLTHVPYKGSAPVMNDLLAGTIPMAFDNLPVALPYIQSGKLRALGVTSVRPSPALPDVPPISQYLSGFEDNIWFGFIGPRGLPAAVAQRIREEIIRAVNAEEVTGPMTLRGATVTTSTAAEMRQIIVDEQKKWQALIQQRAIRIE